MFESSLKNNFFFHKIGGLLLWTSMAHMSKCCWLLNMSYSTLQRHTKRITQRDAKLRDLRKKLGLGDLMIDEDELMDQSQVDNVLRNLKQRNNATQNELTNCKVSIFQYLFNIIR